MGNVHGLDHLVESRVEVVSPPSFGKRHGFLAASIQSNSSEQGSLPVMCLNKEDVEDLLICKLCVADYNIAELTFPSLKTAGSVQASRSKKFRDGGRKLTMNQVGTCISNLRMLYILFNLP